MEYISERDFEKYSLTEEQLRACKKVFAAMRAAGKLGVHFWDMYGTLTAYNRNVFSRLHMHPAPNSIEVTDSEEANELLYYERLDNFHAGCADDKVWLELK